MTETKVDFEIAIKLKKLGFKEETYFSVDEDNEYYTSGNFQNWNEKSFPQYSAPTLAFAQEWIMNNFSVLISVEPSYFEDTIYYSCFIKERDKEPKCKIGINWNDSLLKAIKTFLYNDY